MLSLALSFGLMAATSPEIGGLFLEGEGHQIAQEYGLFMWAGVTLYATVAWRVWKRRNESLASDVGDPAGQPPFQRGHAAVHGMHSMPSLSTTSS